MNIHPPARQGRGSAVYIGGCYFSLAFLFFPPPFLSRALYLLELAKGERVGASCLIRRAEDHLIDLYRKERRYRKFLRDHQPEIARWFDHPPAYPPLTNTELSNPNVKFDGNYQGIRMLDEAVKDKVVSQIEAEILAENVCYDKSFKEIAQEQDLTVNEVVRHYETALLKIKKGFTL